VENVFNFISQIFSKFTKENDGNNHNQNFGHCGRRNFWQQQKDDGPLVHPAFCDCCQAKIVGNRHKCETCPDYDLCDTCLKINQDKPFHAHSFKLINSREYYIEQRKQHCQRFFRGNGPLVHPATCDCCQEQIVGNRHKCETCPDYDLCDTCLKINQDKPFHAHAFKLINSREYYWQQRKQFCQQRCGKSQCQSQPEVKKETPPKSDVNLNSMELETKEVKVQEPVPLSTLKQEVVEPVVETKKETPVQQQPKSPFQEKLEKLEEMGFNDREKNIAILIEKEGDVLNAVRALLANNWIRFGFGENQKKEQICKKFKK